MDATETVLEILASLVPIGVLGTTVLSLNAFRKVFRWLIDALGG